LARNTMARDDVVPWSMARMCAVMRLLRQVVVTPVASPLRRHRSSIGRERTIARRPQLEPSLSSAAD
jgi:hypothetical protein